MKTSIQGALLALTTVLFWSTLPIALKQISSDMSAMTIVCLRFSVAALWLWIWLPHPHARKIPHDWSEGRVLALFATAAACLGGNFVLYNLSVFFLPASAAQILAQMGSLLLLAGGALILREKMQRIQIFGGIMLTGGLLIFFNDKLHELFFPSGEGYAIGVALGILGAMVWAIYGIAQKLLLKEFTSSATLRIIYTCIALGLIPFAHFEELRSISPMQTGFLAFCCLNTIVAYGCFSKALGVWNTMGVGAILSLTPLGTIAGSSLLHFLAPSEFPSAELNPLSCAGAFIVVSGAVLMATGPGIVQHLQKK